MTTEEITPAQAVEIVNKAMVGGYFNDLLYSNNTQPFRKRRALSLMGQRATELIAPMAPGLEIQAFFRGAGNPPKFKAYPKEIK